jgi:16S rRNA (guanine1207-N2)-methyltransferase
LKEQENQAEAADYFFDRSRGPIPPHSRVLLFRPPFGYAPFPTLDPAQIAFCETEIAGASRLESLGFRPFEAQQNAFDLVVVFATKHKEEVLYQLSLGLDALGPEGEIVLVAANDLGAQSLERRFSELLSGPLQVVSKHKCRIVRARLNQVDIDESLKLEWQKNGQLQKLPATGLYACPGVFSWKKIDEGSRWLADSLPSDLLGNGADLGAGVGYLSLRAVTKAPNIQSINLFEAERKALDAARLNLSDCGGTVQFRYTWSDVRAGIGAAEYDFILMNPPFHQGKSEERGLGQTFVQKALQGLKPRGRLFMVANRHLAYEALIEDLGGERIECDYGQGFKLIRAVKR